MRVRRFAAAPASARSPHRPWTPPTHTQTKVATRLTWSAAPRCAGQANATTAARDQLNRLWGWQRNRWGAVAAGREGWEAGHPRAGVQHKHPSRKHVLPPGCALDHCHAPRNCAWKDTSGGASYYPGYIGPRYQGPTSAPAAPLPPKSSPAPRAVQSPLLPKCNGTAGPSTEELAAAIATKLFSLFADATK